MVDPARIRNRIERIEIDRQGEPRRDNLYIDFIVKGDTRWYIEFDFEHRSMWVWKNIRAHRLPKKMRDYLISIIPPDIIAECTAKALFYVPIHDPDGDPF